MIPPLSVSLPLDARFRSLTEQVTSKYVELLGGTAADVQQLTADVNAAVEMLSGQAGATPHVDLVFRHEAGDVRVGVRCGTRARDVRHVLAAMKG
jgi:hypothetical protein